METRSMKKKKTNARSWSDLPQDLLFLIISRLFLSIPDLFAVAAVCRLWRAAATAATAATAALTSGDFPPFLLNPILSPNRGRPIWFGAPKCQLQTLTPNPRWYRSMVSSKTLRKRCVGCSNGNLIFNLGEKALIVDAFTGEKIRSPRFPPAIYGPHAFHIGILTAPMSWASCTLILVADSCTLCWRLDSYAWAREDYLRYKTEISALVAVNGFAFCLNELFWVEVVDFNSLPATRKTLVLGLRDPPIMKGKFEKFIVECGAEILLVLFARVGELKFRIDVYQLDFESVMWVKMENLGDWCLFIDVAGSSPVACSNPARWGGRSNCIYVAGPGYDNWSVFPLNGSVIDATAWKSALTTSLWKLRCWPSPIWVYPSKLCKQGTSLTLTLTKSFTESSKGRKT